MPKIAKHGRTVLTRVSDQGHALLVKRASEETEGNVSEIVRRMLKYASVYMPKGWK